MKFARICDVRTFLGYGELTDEQTGASLEKSVPLKNVFAKDVHQIQEPESEEEQQKDQEEYEVISETTAFILRLAG